MINLISDTVTKPTPAMMDVMMSAEVGDDVFGADPSINALQEKAADMFGMEASLFCPSGTMTNQIAINVHTSPGDEVICSRESHIYNYEGGGIAKNSSAQVRLVMGETGMFTAQDVLDNINPSDSHYTNTRLVSIENTSNRGGGCCYNLDDIAAIGKACKDNGLGYHLDGARLFNAMVSNNEDPKFYGQHLDSISICLSKGMGAPVGSLLLGTKDFIAKSHRVRKSMGGGMRQAGFLAAAASYALDNYQSWMPDDHRRGKEIGNAAIDCTYVSRVITPETNIVVFEIEGISDADYLAKLEQKGILAIGFGPGRIRMVTHLDFSDDQLTDTIAAMKSLS